MIIKTADFLKSSSDYRQCPGEDKPEFAFIGRSNVGKSSLINALVNRKDLAKTSSQPGKTQMINHFILNNEWYLVDLPGYGYAKASKSVRESWNKMIRNYLLKRRNLIWCLWVNKALMAITNKQARCFLAYWIGPKQPMLAQ